MEGRTGLRRTFRRTQTPPGSDLIFRSTDGGHSWKTIPHPHVPDFFGNVRSVPGTTTGWAVGAHGKILRSTDAGKTWKVQQPGFSVAFGVTAPSKRVGWVSGIEGVASTASGGKRWDRQRPEPGAWYSVTALDANTAWAGVQEEIDDVPGAIWKH
jgi:photosystem II stability/assembly factor-like uncharacterized protein